MAKFAYVHTLFLLQCTHSKCFAGPTYSARSICRGHAKFLKSPLAQSFRHSWPPPAIRYAARSTGRPRKLAVSGFLSTFLVVSLDLILLCSVSYLSKVLPGCYGFFRYCFRIPYFCASVRSPHLIFNSCYMHKQLRCTVFDGAVFISSSGFCTADFHACRYRYPQDVCRHIDIAIVSRRSNP